MLSLLFHLLFNPGALMGVLGIAAIAAGIYFTMGPLTLIKIATDIRTWFAIALVLAFLAFAHAEKRAETLEKKVDAAAQQHTSDVDATKTTQLRVEQKAKRQVQSTRLQEAITHAPPEQAEDALLDAIAQDHPDDHPSSRPADRLRKHPDGVVVP
jgi:membrane protein implicated in regulation of membrane protease activity